MNTYDKAMTAVLAVCVLPVVAVFVAAVWGFASAATFGRAALTAFVAFVIGAVLVGLLTRTDR